MTNNTEPKLRPTKLGISIKFYYNCALVCALLFCIFALTTVVTSNHDYLFGILSFAAILLASIFALIAAK